MNSFMGRFFRRLADFSRFLPNPVVDGEIDTEMIDRAAADINEIPISDRIGLAEAFLANTHDK